MKKILALGLFALLLVAAVCIYRAETYFTDRQLPPAQLGAFPAIDEAGAVQRLAGAIRFPTLSWDDRSRFDAAAFEGLHRYLEKSFPLTHQRLHRIRVGYSLVYRLDGSDPDLDPVLFMGHQDVVPVDDITLDQWTHPPFDGVVADGWIWGRGTLDDKFSVLGLLEATEMLLAGGFTPERTVYLAFGHDEEVSGRDGAQTIARQFEQQGIRFEFVLDEGGAVLEDGLIEGVSDPVAVIGVAEKGYVNLRLVVRDEGGHSSEPPSHTAAGILAQAIVRVEDHPFPARLEPMFIMMDVLGKRLPFSRRLALANTWLLGPRVERAMLADRSLASGVHTTTAVTMLSGSSKSNILPTRAEAVVNFRILPGETSQTVRDHIVRAIDDPRVEVIIEMATEPSPISSTDSAGYRLLAGTIRALDPQIVVTPYMVRGGTDARWFMGLSDNVYRFYMARFTPDVLKLAHGIDEHVSIDNYLEGVRFFYHALEQAGRAEF